MINSVSSTNGESLLRRGKSYLRGSVSVQKASVKLAARGRKTSQRGERSQCVRATLRNEGACRRHPGGWHFGLIEARAPALRAKRGSRSITRFSTGPMRSTPVGFSGDSCRHLGTTEDHVTIELPRRLRVSPGVIPGDKALPKRLGHASADGTALLRPVSWGTQLNQSRLGSTSPLKGCSAGNGGGPSRIPSGKLARRLKPHSVRRVPLRASTRPPLSNRRTILGSQPLWSSAQ